MGEIYNTTSITRDWLQGVLEEQLFLSQKGIHLVSDPGHGKTSIISQLVCAKPSSLWYKLRNTVIFYHICRFDRSSTQNPAMFITNFAEVITAYFPVIGNFLLFDKMVQNFIAGIQCSEDPIECFEYVILRPLLKHIDELPSKKYTIVIDALDECQTDKKKRHIGYII